MTSQNIMIVAVLIIVAVAFLAFLIWKNQKDKKLINPDAQDAVEDEVADQERNKKRI